MKTIFRFFTIIITICLIAGVACSSPIKANSQASLSSVNSQDAIASEVYTCRSQISVYSEQPLFDMEFDFVDADSKNLPVVIKPNGKNEDGKEVKILDALSGNDGDYTYWTTPVIRDYTLEKTHPLVISLEPSKQQFSSKIAQLNALLKVKFRRKKFPITCALRAILEKNSQTFNSVESEIPNVAEVYICRGKISRENLPIFDVEFNFLYRTSVGKRYPYGRDSFYVKMTKHLGEKLGTVQILETTFGSDGDDSFWTTPVIRDVAGGTMAITIDLVPGIRPMPDRTIAQQLTEGFSVNFFDKTFPVKCDR